MKTAGKQMKTKGTTRSNDSTLNEAKGWLQARGFPLELRVQGAFVSQGFSVQPGHYVKVDDDEVPREIDLLATQSTQIMSDRITFEFYVECKWARSWPWVVFAAKNQKSIPPEAALNATTSNPMGKALLWLMDGDSSIYGRVPFGFAGSLGYGGRQTVGDEKGKNRDVFYVAMQSVASIARRGVGHVDPMATAVAVSSEAKFAFPVVVVDGPLYEAVLSTDNDLHLAAIPRARVHWRGLEAENFTPIDVVTIDGLENYLQCCVRDLKEVMNSLPTVYWGVAQAYRTGDADGLRPWLHRRKVPPPIFQPILLRGLLSKLNLPSATR